MSSHEVMLMGRTTCTIWALLGTCSSHRVLLHFSYSYHHRVVIACWKQNLSYAICIVAMRWKYTLKTHPSEGSLKPAGVFMSKLDWLGKWEQGDSKDTVMSEANGRPLAPSCCYSHQLHQCCYTTVSSALLTSSKTFCDRKNNGWMADFRSGRTLLLRSRNNPNHVNHAVPRTAVSPADST